MASTTTSTERADAIVSSRHLRIAHVTNYQVPGYGYEEMQLALEQVKMGHEVVIFASNFLHPLGLYSILRKRFPSRQVPPREEVAEGVRVQRLRSHEIGRRAWIHGLERAIRAFDPDVVHVHNVLQFHAPRLALMRIRGSCRAAIVVDDHMHIGFMRRSALGRAFYFTYRTFVQPILSRYVDRYCAIAADTAEYLHEQCGVTGPIEVVPLGVPAQQFKADPARRRRARKRLGIADSDLVLIYTGKVIPEKGVHLLVEAAAQMRGVSATPTALAVGDSDEAYAAYLAATAAAAGVDLRLCPSVPYNELPDWYACADIGVWPRQESMAVFEAMSMSLPVVISAESGLVAAVETSGALSYEPETAAALAATLTPLLDRELRRRLGAQARAFIESGLTWHRSAERYVEIYREAIAARKTR